MLHVCIVCHALDIYLYVYYTPYIIYMYIAVSKLHLNAFWKLKEDVAIATSSLYMSS